MAAKNSTRTTSKKPLHPAGLGGYSIDIVAKLPMRLVVDGLPSTKPSERTLTLRSGGCDRGDELIELSIGGEAFEINAGDLAAAVASVASREID